MNKLKTFDLSYSIGKNYFEEGGMQNYLVFQPIIRYFKVNTINNVTDYVLSWQSKSYLLTLLNSLIILIIVLRQQLVIMEIGQNKSKVYWKLFKTR